MKLLLKVLIPVLVLVGSVFAAKMIVANRPEPRSRPQFPVVASVEATRLSTSQYPVVIRSQGSVQPTVATPLVPEVAGSITALSNAFVVGGEFEAGEVLARIDQRDYVIALTQANANLAQADARLQEEQALAERAQADWNSLGRGGTPSALTLRKPQMAAASANLDAARAEVQRARLNLERTRIVAPYDGRVLERQVDAGQFVNRGATIGRIHSVESVDIRLPLSNRQLTWLQAPDAGSPTLPNVELSATVGGVENVWAGKLVRVEGVDEGTQQLTVVAQVDDPFGADATPLRVGQFVNAIIEGQILEDVFVIPRSALREDREVLILDDESRLHRQAVSVAWADEQVAAINDGLEPGAILVLTPLSTVTDGTPVRATIDGEAPPPVEGRRQGQRGNGAGRPGAQGGADGAGRRAGRPGAEGGADRGPGRPPGRADGAGNGQGRPQGEGVGGGERRRGNGERPAGNGQRSGNSEG